MTVIQSDTSPYPHTDALLNVIRKEKTEISLCSGDIK